MLLLTLLNLITAIPTVIFSLFPKVTALPFGIDSILVQGSGYIHFLVGVIPPLGIMLNGLLYIIGFKILMMFIRIIPIIGRMFSN